MLRTVRDGALCLCLCAGPTLADGYLGPLPYLAFNNPDAGPSQSPWRHGGFAWFHLEDFEDGVLNTPGVDLVEAASVGGLAITFSDSVDGDDGVIDGVATNTRSLFSNFRTDSFTFDFNADTLGRLPTHVGMVWTDVGRNNGGTPLPTNLINNVEFEAWDGDGISLGVFGPFSLGDESISRTTDEDRFIGIVSAAGIRRVQLRMPGLNNWEMDHLQYGLSCPADLAAPAGVLNFFDLAAYLALFNSQDPAADLAAPTGVLNFFDLSAYITLYNQGCP